MNSFVTTSTQMQISQNSLTNNTRRMQGGEGKNNLTHYRTTTKALKQQKRNKGTKDPRTPRHQKILLQPIH
jgi:hypothetical protein